MEKYFVHALQKYRIELFRFVLRMTDEVERQTGHLKCFIYTLSITRLWYDYKQIIQLQVPDLLRYRLDTDCFRVRISPWQKSIATMYTWKNSLAGNHK